MAVPDKNSTGNYWTDMKQDIRLFSAEESALRILEKYCSITNPAFYGLDLNSRFEIEPGLKDIEKLKKFINELRNKNKLL